MNPLDPTQPIPLDEPHPWIGGEAALGRQAEHHVRQLEGRPRGLFTTIIVLTFIGGVALGGALGSLWKHK